MNPDDVQRWLDAYVTAWRTYDQTLIADLFAEDATYTYYPWAEPVTGRDSIVAAWISDRDKPDSWEAEYQPFLVAGNRAVVTGETRYTNGELFMNIWQLSFDANGNCSEFVEWYMTPPPSS
jgi:hypothetical protein